MNAQKFTTKGYVEFRVCGVKNKESKEDYGVRFEIRDTGIGIKKDRLEQIFNLNSPQDDYDHT
jgi:signal transduction histidine kinase